MDELETCIAALFKRKGKSVITDNEFVFAVSLDYRWFTPKEAQDLLELALKRGLLVRSDDFLKPAFDPKDQDIPMSFRPSKDILSAKPEEELSLFAKLLKDISTQSGIKKRDVVARINKIQEKIGVDVEVAALLMAKEVGINPDVYFEEVWKEVCAK
ncbi:DUF2240 family protein [Candidatus Methanomassiliicoccus intestinalis]|uniref:DUF2240 family protein n=1 Tax=Candidatus Methanomassiliicoccus intestinalis TaxID=1406512 RepID=UPI0037DC10FA